jgi:hypothetical protein
MNYISLNYNNAAYFYPDNSGNVGNFTKAVPSQTLVTFDYTSIFTATQTITQVAFLLDVQTNPQLVISGLQIVGAKNILSWIVSGGLGNITYNLSAVVTLSDNSVRTDVVQIQVIGDDDVGCCNPCGGQPIGVTSIPPGYQQAGLIQNGIYINSQIRYYVSNTAPIGANIMDQWYNTNNDTLYEYITDGNTSWWQNPANPLVPSGPSNSLYYIATQGQTVFHTTSPDAQGQMYTLTTNSLVALYVNGVLYTPNVGSVGDYLLNVSSSTATLGKGLTSGDIVTFRIGVSQ